jgi:hypothetical protein
MRALVRWAVKCDSAEQLGERLRRRYSGRRAIAKILPTLLTLALMTAQRRRSSARTTTRAATSSAAQRPAKARSRPRPQMRSERYRVLR